jgi:hypothetical protein
MEIGKAIACLRRELNDLDRMIDNIEERIAASSERRGGSVAGTRARDVLSTLTAPFQEPEFGLWLQ